MPKVETRKVEEVQYQGDFCDYEFAVDPKEDEECLEDVVHDEVGADVGGCVDEVSVEGGEVVYVN